MVTRRRDARQSKGPRATVVRAALASVAIGIALAPPPLAGSVSSAGATAASERTSTADAAAASQAPPARRVELVDATAAAGISFEHLYGGPDKRYIMEMAGSGAAWIDYDVDGRVDLVLVNGLPDVTADPPAAAAAYRRGEVEAPDGAGHRLFRNRGGNVAQSHSSQWTFDDVTAAAGIGDVVWGNGAAVADIDNDGFPDLYVTAIGANALYRNNGDGTFSRWPSGAEDPSWSTSAAFTDWDGDGNLDLYVANYLDFDAELIRPQGEGACMYRGVDVHCGPEGLTGEVDVFYRNDGDGSFVPWPGAEIDAEATFGFALVATDCDGDGRPDIYVASDSTINLLYRHGADGGIEDWSLFSGAGYSGSGREQAGMGATAADYDGDGDFDLFVTNFQHDYNTLYTNVGDCFFDDDTARLGLAVDSLPYMGWGAQFLDIDGDGDQDIFVANGHVYPQMDAADLEPWAQRNLLYLNQLAESGAPGFREAGEQAGPGMQVRAASRGVAVADYDNDFDLDLLVTNINDAPTLLRNGNAVVEGPVPAGEEGAPPAALRITLVGRSMNRSAYGARVTVESGGRTQSFELRGSDGYLGSNDPRLLVALPGGVADRLQVTWGGGETTTLEDVAAGWIVLDERRGVVARRNR